MDLLLGLDVGTTATKAVAFDLKGRIAASASYRYGLIAPREGWVEQDPEELWRGVVGVCRAIVAQIDPGDRIVALSQSSQAGTTIPVDEQGSPTYSAISWMDQRAECESLRVREQFGGDSIRTTTGWALSNGLPLQHIAWLRANRPTVFAATHHVLFVNDFIARRLAGRLCMNPSDAGITQLMNIAEGDWDERLLALAGITRDRLSPIHPSGAVIGPVTAEASAATGLPPELLVVNGAHDQYCAAVGSGVTRPGGVLLSCGTAWVILAVPENREAGLHSGMAVSRHAVEGRWGAIRSLGGVGASLEWFADQIWQADAAQKDRARLYGTIDTGVARSPAGARGVLFYPLSGGHDLANAGKGGFANLGLLHSRDDMARAVMEGVAFELRWAMDEIAEKGIRVAEFKMVGGAAESAVWPRIVADVTGVPVTLPTARQAAARGAAILAGVGAGLFDDVETGFGTFRGAEMQVCSDQKQRRLYKVTFVSYQKTWNMLERANTSEEVQSERRQKGTRWLVGVDARTV
ncbi:MAG: hypothetical protein JXA89_10335 [Anaerolineae bacterium]|nr:hypothetical protein [Anaerolineae bacterium]